MPQLLQKFRITEFVGKREFVKDIFVRASSPQNCMGHAITIAREWHPNATFVGTIEYMRWSDGETSWTLLGPLQRSAVDIYVAKFNRQVQIELPKALWENV